jgi:hypothetical protein
MLFYSLKSFLTKDIVHKPCNYNRCETLGYRCVPFKKKYVVAYLNQDKEIVICDFVNSKLLA